MVDVFRVADMSPQQLRSSIQRSVFTANIATVLVWSAIALGLYVMLH